jgi:hypothetical protein
MVGFCVGWCRCFNNYFINGKFSGYQSGHCQSGEELENGMSANLKIGQFENKVDNSNA